MTELEKLKKLIDKYKTVSFDIFDTLLLRNVIKPSDIFRMMEIEVEKKFKIKDFFNQRVTAEQQARIGKENSEVTLDEIYLELKDVFGKNLLAIQQMEIDLEHKFLVKNPFMYQIYKYAKKQKKKILCISDMYLPKKELKLILKENDYKINPVYVSCEVRKVKGNQSLFQWVEQQENISKASWIHIGDNKVSDYSSPLNFGIAAYHYNSVLNRSKLNNKEYLVEESIIEGIKINQLYNGLELDTWTEFGMKYVGQIYYGFTKWLFQETKNINKLYFLARDGYIVEKIYQLFLDKYKIKKDTHYLYCSRRSLQIPDLVNSDISYATEILTRWNPGTSQTVTLEDIMKVVDLDITKYNHEMKRYNLQKDTIIDFTNHSRFISFLEHIYSDIKKSLEKKLVLVNAYLKQEELNQDSLVNIVDIGWSGSSQYSLKRILNKKIFGYYFGTNDMPYDEIPENSKGFYFTQGLPKQNYNNVIEQIMMYELIFSAPHASTIGYKKEKNRIVPIFERTENKRDYVEKFQEGALDIVKKTLEYDEYLSVQSSNLYLNDFNELLNKREYKYVQLFSEVNEAIGYDGKMLNFVQTFTKQEAYQNASDFFEVIKKSLWRNAYLITDLDKLEYQKFEKKIFIKSFNIKKILKKIMRIIKRVVKKIINLIRIG